MTIKELPQEMHIHSKGLIHLGFKLDTKEFLMPISDVKEIIMLPTITFIPNAEPMMEGIFALRGEIMPVVNLRRMMNLSPGIPTTATRVIHIESIHGGFGLVVDEITEFVDLISHDIENIDQHFFGAKYPFLSGVAKTGNSMRAVLEVTRLVQQFSVFTQEEE